MTSKRVELQLNDGIMGCLDELIKIYEKNYSTHQHGKEMTYQDVIELLIIGEAMKEEVIPF